MGVMKTELNLTNILWNVKKSDAHSTLNVIAL